MKEQLQKYLDLKSQFKVIEVQTNDAIRDIVNLANTEYWKVEKRLSKKYGYDYAATCYDFAIPIRDVDRVSPTSIRDTYFIVECSSNWEGETFYWDIKIPFNMENLPDFIQEFETKMEKQTLKGIERNNKNKIDSRETI